MPAIAYVSPDRATYQDRLRMYSLLDRVAV